MNDTSAGSTSSAGTSKKGWRPAPKQVVGAVVLVLAVIFALLNTQEVTVDVAFDELASPLWLVMLVLLAVGVVIGLLLPVGRKKK